MLESAKILNKTKRFPGSAYGSWARNEEQYLGKFSIAEFGRSSIFQGCEVFRDQEMESLEEFLIKLKIFTKKQFFSLHSFPSPTSHRSSWLLFCLVISVIALPIPENAFKVRLLCLHMEVGPQSRDLSKNNFLLIFLPFIKIKLDDQCCGSRAKLVL